MDIHRKGFTYEQWRRYRSKIMQKIVEIFRR